VNTHSVAVIIVSWNTRALLRNCLLSLQETHRPIADRFLAFMPRVIVVDSASSDGSPDMLRADFPAVELIASDTNIGYVAGNNLAMQRVLTADATEPAYLWLLNPDTVVHAGALQTLLEFMQTHPRCGLCGPKLENPDGTLQHGAFGLPGLAQLAIDVVPRLQARFRNTRLDGRYPPAMYAGAPFQIGTPLGAAMFARTAAAREIGLLDNGFEMYSEEIDWAKRMHDAQWEVWCEPAAVVTHFGGASSSQALSRTERLKWRSRQRYFAKHYSPPKRWLAQRFVPAEFRSPVPGG
jgi:N-acetylglucosaminyl-diphospho-decaprenol L-rhamnosyltransferase